MADFTNKSQKQWLRITPLTSGDIEFYCYGWDAAGQWMGGWCNIPAEKVDEIIEYLRNMS